MEIIIIVAMAKNRTIGANNRLPWHIPEELKLFKKTTMGHPMIMGRKTFDSFPAPLPGRRHIVLSRNANYRPDGVDLASSMDEALAMCEGAEKVFVIGGAEIFAHALPVTTKILLTLINREVEGDVFFPEFSTDEFVEEGRTHYPDASEPFSVVTYCRK